MEVQISSYWRIGKKWDALWIPKPFAKLTVIFHTPLEVQGSNEEELPRLDAAMGAK